MGLKSGGDHSLQAHSYYKWDCGGFSMGPKSGEERKIEKNQCPKKAEARKGGKSLANL